MLLFLRSLLFSIGMLISTVVHATLSLLLFWLPFEKRYRFIMQWSRFVLWWLKITCRVDYEIQGKENVPDTPCIVLCKHQSTWETLALQTLFVPQATLLKKELLHVPFFGWVLRLLEPIAINRSRTSVAMKQLLSEGKQRLQARRWLIIFPEGTRIPSGQTRKFSLGGAILANSTGYPVLPIAHNAGQFWPRRQFIKKPGTIQFVIGPAIQSEDKSTREINQLSEDWINQTVERISVPDSVSMKE